MRNVFTESAVEQAALAWLEASDWPVARGRGVASKMCATERAESGGVVLARRMGEALDLVKRKLPEHYK